jgi:hypothetical protein
MTASPAAEARKKAHDKVRAAAWRKRNPDKARAYAQARYKRDRERLLANAKAWKARNRERRAAYDKAYRARQNKAGAAIPLKPLEALSSKYLARLTAAAKKLGITVSELRREGLTYTARGRNKVEEARTRRKQSGV